jgi:hypothetical protein
MRIWLPAVENDTSDIKMKKRVKNTPELKNKFEAAWKTVLKGGRKEALHNMAREAGVAIEVTDVKWTLRKVGKALQRDHCN